MRLLLALLSCLLAISGHAFAQVAVQQSAQRFDAASATGYTQQAVNATTPTVTITPTAGNYVYLTGVGIDEASDATGVAATNVGITVTGFANGTFVMCSFSTALTVNGDSSVFGANQTKGCNEMLAVPLRSSAPGTAVTLAGPTSTHIQFTIRAYYYVAP